MLFYFPWFRIKESKIVSQNKWYCTKYYVQIKKFPSLLYLSALKFVSDLSF